MPMSAFFVVTSLQACDSGFSLKAHKHHIAMVSRLSTQLLQRNGAYHLWGAAYRFVFKNTEENNCPYTTYQSLPFFAAGNHSFTSFDDYCI